jgi:hypothetical protein
MKKLLLTVAAASAVCLAMFLLQGCIKDSYTRTYTYSYYQPVFQTKQEVRDNIKSNPAQPIERPGKIYIKGQYIFLNEIDKGIHIIDNSNPASPQRIGFITIPGNLDIAVKGNTLYADLYTDLVAIDISNPHNVVLKKTIENVFPYRYFGIRSDSTKIIARWEKRDTTVKQTFDIGGWARTRNVFMEFSALNSGSGSGGSFSSAAPYGMGGSMARFALSHERLYTVGNQNLDVFNISNAVNPVSVLRKHLGWNIETIYPFRNKLFIGLQTGMFIYNINNPDNPVQEGQFSHARVCDPVIADNNYAYVTLRSGNTCVGFTNQLDIVSLQTANPTLVKTYAMTNPHGLSKDGNTLFICDGRDGLKVYNASNVTGLQLIKHITGIDTYDVIAFNNIALVIAKDGIYQYDYADLNNITLKSKMTITK